MPDIKGSAGMYSLAPLVNVDANIDLPTTMYPLSPLVSVINVNQKTTTTANVSLVEVFLVYLTLGT